MKQRLLNIVVLGGSGVGKTCLVSRLVEDTLPAFYQSTPKAVSNKSVTLGKNKYTCLITDTASHGTYTPISPQFIIGTHAFILVYSIASKDSFDLVKLMHEKLVEFCYPASIAPVIIIGNKNDLNARIREVSVEEGRDLARQLQSPFLETTALDYQAVYNALEACIANIEGRRYSTQLTPTIIPSSSLLLSLSKGYWKLHNLAISVHRSLMPSIERVGSRLAQGDVAMVLSRFLSSAHLPTVPTLEVKAPETQSQAVAIPSAPPDPHEDSVASTTLTASVPILKDVWSRHQASLPSKGRLSSPYVTDIAPIQVDMRAEDLISNSLTFVRSVDEALAQIICTSERISLPWGRKVSDDRDTILPKTCHELARVFLSISEDRTGWRALSRLTGDHAQVVLDALQLILDTEIASVTQADRTRLLHLLLKLAKDSGRYPECLMLSDIIPQDNHAVAAGHFGEIWKGVFRDRAVCMKVLKVYQRSDVKKLLKIFSKEAILWSQLNHVNLLPFYGIHQLNDSLGRICLIAPWMDNGCLPDYLIAQPGANRFMLAKDVCNGLQHLHNSGIVHGDLKGVNILITQSGSACVADFGLSSVAESDLTRWSSLASSTAAGGTARWQAPELFNPDVEDMKLTKMSDVYSLGCVFYEIFTGRIPFYEATREPMVISYVQFGKQPSKPAPDTHPFQEWGLSNALWSCIEECWSRVPEERPTIPYLVLKLASFAQRSGIAEPVSAPTGLRGNGWLTPAEVRNSIRGNGMKSARGSLKDIPGRAKGSVKGGNRSSASSFLEWFSISV